MMMFPVQLLLLVNDETKSLKNDGTPVFKKCTRSIKYQFCEEHNKKRIRFVHQRLIMWEEADSENIFDIFSFPGVQGVQGSICSL